MLSNRLDSTQIEQLVKVDVDPSYRKSICKKKYPASGYERGWLQILSSRVDSTRIERLATVDVDTSYRLTL